jgi:hypothetical protein
MYALSINYLNLPIIFLIIKVVDVSNRKIMNKRIQFIFFSDITP